MYLQLMFTDSVKGWEFNVDGYLAETTGEINGMPYKFLAVYEKLEDDSEHAEFIIVKIEPDFEILA